MKPIVYALSMMMIVLTSCVKHSADYQRLKAQNDSLMRAKQSLQSEVDNYFSAMSEIEQNIEKIKSTENTISLQPIGKDLDEDQRSKINEDMAYLSDMLQTNKEQLAKLKEKLRRSSFKSAELERNIARLTKALEDETTKVAMLQSQLAQKDSLINQLGSKVDQLGNDVSQLSVDNKNKDIRIKEQEDALHTAWYVYGTKDELKEQKIITPGGLFRQEKVLQNDFNNNYFVRIDSRNTKSIPLYSAKAKILTNHPKSSYTLEKVNGNFVLLITNPDAFWSVSKYLVIQVD